MVNTSAQGRHEEAGSFYRTALEITEAFLGKDHPNVSHILNNLAGVLKAQVRPRVSDCNPASLVSDLSGTRSH